MKESGPTLCRTLAAQRRQDVKVREDFVYTDKRCPGASCQMAHIRAICCGFQIGCVLTAEQLLQACNRMKPRPALLGDLGSIGLFHIRTRLPCARWSATSPCSSQVKSTLVLIHSPDPNIHFALNVLIHSFKKKQNRHPTIKCTYQKKPPKTHLA